MVHEHLFKLLQISFPYACLHLKFYTSPLTLVTELQPD